ncbi:hypothetical protein DMH04_53500 [Kibdelosporangium aridum]|uniref:Uncharacterized protein n=1 Tax=Kibdelosporangium aridum TaxID=2030 RepID=A0A428Y2X7_KIBAR|nr:hypothetical protein [Kibdelosporangium aridum]RSM61925.1 hypothetical protein DMH04_53500 [Kibdelosporangium aridum]
MGRWRTLAITTGMALAAGLIMVPGATAEAGGRTTTDQAIQSVTPFCNFERIFWAVAGNWDGIGGDGIGVVVDRGGVLTWYLRNAPNAGPADYIFSFGLSGDRPVVGNWDGIGGDGPGIVRSSITDEWQWHLRNGNNAGHADYILDYGRRNYYPVTGNWDGVGGDGVGVAGGNASGYKAWHLRNSPSPGRPDHDFTYGRTGTDGPSTDFPIAGNWDGVGGDGPGIVRDVSTQLQWHERNSLNAGPGDHIFNYGVTRTDCVVVGNWDGVGGDGPGIVRGNPNGNGELQWHLRNGNNPGPAEAIFDYS